VILQGSKCAVVMPWPVARGWAALGQQDQTIYDDTLQHSWTDWSWATVDFAGTASPHSGSACIRVSAAAYEALYLHHSAFDPGGIRI